MSRTFERAITIARPLAEVFPFFASPANLGELTPPWLRFEVVTPQPIEMKVGVEIEYRLRLHGIPLGWTSRISAYDPPHRFVDEQVRGPYRIWVHEHVFEERDGATEVIDRVQYAAPGGALIERFFVRPDLVKIFAYRHQRLLEVFGE